MTFGQDFAFVGNQYHLEKFGVEQFPDLLFFNRELSALVCVELKDGPFKTAYLGQLAGYLRILDDEVRKPNENPSIGIILCKSANKKFVKHEKMQLATRHGTHWLYRFSRCYVQTSTLSRCKPEAA